MDQIMLCVNVKFFAHCEDTFDCSSPHHFRVSQLSPQQLNKDYVSFEPYEQQDYTFQGSWIHKVM